jgi:hypothetical protein
MIVALRLPPPGVIAIRHVLNGLLLLAIRRIVKGRLPSRRASQLTLASSLTSSTRGPLQSDSGQAQLLGCGAVSITTQGIPNHRRCCSLQLTALLVATMCSSLLTNKTQSLQSSLALHNKLLDNQVEVCGAQEADANARLAALIQHRQTEPSRREQAMSFRGSGAEVGIGFRTTEGGTMQCQLLTA